MPLCSLSLYWSWCFQAQGIISPQPPEWLRPQTPTALCSAPRSFTGNLHCRAELLSHLTLNIALEETTELPISTSEQTILSWPWLCRQTTGMFRSPQKRLNRKGVYFSPLSHYPRIPWQYQSYNCLKVNIKINWGVFLIKEFHFFPTSSGLRRPEITNRKFKRKITSVKQ